MVASNLTGQDIGGHVIPAPSSTPTPGLAQQAAGGTQQFGGANGARLGQQGGFGGFGGGFGGFGGGGGGWAGTGAANDAQFQPQINRLGQINRQELAQYESGKLTAGDAAAINLATESAQNDLTQEYASMGRTGPDTSFGQGMDLIAQEKSAATQQALNNYLQNFYQGAGLQGQLTAAKASADTAVLDAWLQQEKITQAGSEFQQTQTDSILGSLFGGIGKLFGGTNFSSFFK